MRLLLERAIRIGRFRITMSDETGLVLNIQRLSTEDGPGLRTTLFVKGCPLKCKWCHNPETQNYDPDLQYDREKCTGCGLCVAACPGQACFLVDDDFAPGRASVGFPYEYLPRPVKGMTVTARNNQGEDLCEGIVEQVIERKANNQTAIVRISVPLEYGYQVRGMKRLPQNQA